MESGRLWINLFFCGYSLKDTILLQLRHVGFLEVYKRTNHHQFLNDYICFNGNGRCEENFGGPLIRQLALFHGCRFETMEVMWKYYRALYCCGHRRMARKETAYKKLLAARLADADRAEADRVAGDDSECALPDDPEELLSLIRIELDKDNIEKFSSCVDAVYRRSFTDQYINFVRGDGYLLNREHIIDLSVQE